MKPFPFIAELGKEGVYPINLYLEPEHESGDGPVLVATPGSSELLDLSNYNPVLGLYVWDSKLWTVCGASLYSIDSNWSATNEGTVSGGNVFFEDNGNQLFIVTGTSAYYYESSTLTEVTLGFNPSCLTYQDGYFIATEEDTGNFYICNLLAGETWDILDIGTTYGNPDNLVGVISNNRILRLLGANSIEPFWNSGNTDFPFERLSGGFLEVGCGAVKSITKRDGFVFFLDNRRMVRQISGEGKPIIISTSRLNSIFSSYSTVSDAIGWTMFYNGHLFYALVFPTEDKSWLYDAMTQRWTEWQGWQSSSKYGRHWANCYAYFNGKHIYGHYLNGKLYEMGGDVYKDGDNILRIRHIYPPIDGGKNRVFFDRMEFDFVPGVGLITGQGSNPIAMIDWSDDDRKTWSGSRWLEIGEIGEYEQKAVIRRNGSAYKRSFRVTMTDPVYRGIKGLSGRIRVTKN